MFTITKKSKKSHARSGMLKTRRGDIHTPFFMPIATKGAIKSISANDIRLLSPEIILSNTYHQLLRPGVSVLKKAGGLHSFVDWHGPMLTDSGGFQVFSLSKIRKILPHGVRFRSYIDGKAFLLTPKKVLEIQEIIGSDIRMILDVCPAYPATRKQAEDAVRKTTHWATISRKAIDSHSVKDAALRLYGSTALFFAIIQGSTYEDLRKRSAAELVALDFDGYAIGGLAVGEPGKTMLDVLDYTVPELPESKPRYLMGVGYPDQIIEAIRRGIDMFDCVIPTREARHGRLYFWKKSKNPFTYETISISNKKFIRDMSAIDAESSIPELRVYTKAYLSHLFKTQESLGQRLATLNNVAFYLELMRRIRVAIKKGAL